MSIDAHCHIDLHRDPKAIVDSAIKANLRVVAVTTTPAAFKISATFSDKHRGVFPALGMHPEVVGTRPNDIELFRQYLDDVTWVGEIGLDGSKRFCSSWNQQVAAFERILQECANAGGRILSIHSRAAPKKVLELLSKHPKAGKPVLHWFSGNLSELSTAVAMGAYFSVNLPMLQSNSGAALVRNIPLDRLLTESDAPFTASDQHLTLADQLLETEGKLSKLLGQPVSDLKRTMEENFDVLTSVKVSTKN